MDTRIDAYSLAEIDKDTPMELLGEITKFAEPLSYDEVRMILALFSRIKPKYIDMNAIIEYKQLLHDFMMYNNDRPLFDAYGDRHIKNPHGKDIIERHLKTMLTSLITALICSTFQFSLFDNIREKMKENRNLAKKYILSLSMGNVDLNSYDFLKKYNDVVASLFDQKRKIEEMSINIVSDELVDEILADDRLWESGIPNIGRYINDQTELCDLVFRYVCLNYAVFYWIPENYTTYIEQANELIDETLEQIEKLTEV